MWPLSTSMLRNDDPPSIMAPLVDVIPTVFLALVCGTEEGRWSPKGLKVRFAQFLWSGSLSVAQKL